MNKSTFESSATFAVNTTEKKEPLPVGLMQHALGFVALSVGGAVLFSFLLDLIGLPVRPWSVWPMVLALVGFFGWNYVRQVKRGYYARHAWDWWAFIAFACVVLGFLAYALWLGRPDFLPVGTTVDAVHQFGLADYINSSGRLPIHALDQKPNLQDGLQYPPAYVIIVSLLSQLTSINPVYLLYPVVAFFAALAAGATFAVVAKLLEKRRWRLPVAGLAASFTLLPYGYTFGSFTFQNYFAQVMAEASLLMSLFFLLAWRQEGGWESLALFGLAVSTLVIGYPTWAAIPLSALVLVTLFWRKYSWRARLAYLGGLLAPVALLAILFLKDRLETGLGTVANEGDVLSPDLTRYGWPVLILATFGLALTLVWGRAGGRIAVLFCGLVALEGLGFWVLKTSFNKGSYYSVYKLFYPAAYLLPVLAALGLDWFLRRLSLQFSGKSGQRSVVSGQQNSGARSQNSEEILTTETQRHSLLKDEGGRMKDELPELTSSFSPHPSDSPFSGLRDNSPAALAQGGQRDGESSQPYFRYKNLGALVSWWLKLSSGSKNLAGALAAIALFGIFLAWTWAAHPQAERPFAVITKDNLNVAYWMKDNLKIGEYSVGYNVLPGTPAYWIQVGILKQPRGVHSNDLLTLDPLTFEGWFYAPDSAQYLFTDDLQRINLDERVKVLYQSGSSAVLTRTDAYTQEQGQRPSASVQYRGEFQNGSMGLRVEATVSDEPSQWLQVGLEIAPVKGGPAVFHQFVPMEAGRPRKQFLGVVTHLPDLNITELYSNNVFPEKAKPETPLAPGDYNAFVVLQKQGAELERRKLLDFSYTSQGELKLITGGPVVLGQFLFEGSLPRALPQIPPANLELNGDKFSLQALDIASSGKAGETVQVASQWELAAPTTESYRLKWSWLDQNMQIPVSTEALPLNGLYPTWMWPAGKAVNVTQGLKLPGNPGRYRLVVELVDTKTGRTSAAGVLDKYVEVS